jgi:hypothetical protein
MGVAAQIGGWARRRGWRLAPALIALAWLVYGLAGLHAHGTTSDEPSLFYAGDRTLFWLLHPRAPHALDFAGPEPAGFTTDYERFPTWDDPMHYPVLPSLIGAVTSAIVHDGLGWLDVVDGHHLGLVLLNVLAIWLFGRWAMRLLGTTAGVAATLALALYPSGVGHAFNNPKDWPSAMFTGIALLAAATGAIENRGGPMLWAGLFLGLSLSCKLNGVFCLVAIGLWAPLAYLLLYRKRRPEPRAPSVGLVGGTLLIPYVSGAVFIALWPWLYTGRGLADLLPRLTEYLGFMLSYGTNQRTWWTLYPWRTLFFMTPPLVLAAALVAIGRARRAGQERIATVVLMLIAGAFPLMRAAAPGSNFYDANRHFLEYAPPLCALAGLGAAELAALLPRLAALLPPRAARLRPHLPAAAALLAVAALIWPVAAYRPYETTYFNAFIGGLGGAQRHALFYLPTYKSLTNGANGTEGDYWWSATRAGVEAAHALDPRAPIALCGSSTVLLPRALRGPASGIRFTSRDDRDALVFVSPREGPLFCAWRIVRDLESRRPVLERVERGGGLVWEILGPDTGTRFSPPTPENRYMRLPAD